MSIHTPTILRKTQSAHSQVTETAFERSRKQPVVKGDEMGPQEGARAAFPLAPCHTPEVGSHNLEKAKGAPGTMRTLPSLMSCSFCCCDTALTKTNLGRGRAGRFFHLTSQSPIFGVSQGQGSSRNLVAGTEAKPTRNAAYWSPSFAHAQSRSLVRAGTALSGLSPLPHQPSVKPMPHRHARRPVGGRRFII